MDGGGGERWSAVADAWAELWGALAAPVWPPLLAAAHVGAGTRVLDVGCGTGELLGHLARAGAVTAGVDPAPAMARRARERYPGATVLDGDVEHLPFGDDAFDVVLAVNALQFADDSGDALAEIVRVLVPGGRVGIACWAEGPRNDLDVVERAVAAAHEEEVPPDGPLRAPGGLETVLARAGLDVVGSGIVDVPWTAPDDRSLVRGVLLGEDESTMVELAPVVVAAAIPFRATEGYRLANAFRWAVARSA
ncbi:class I SAM-dependent methyltransferase [Krasilnikoviella flava]|uniref:Methyltransferase domain-containing protein n=1 Tax=Krasilnikoviella flava TaxID=526729 RepID=A0A1T5KZ23_9MICO|nr:class I SAM-dependent methyltransferase [Krasilnikoviella flava]SKC69072.1 Methyltransferase domain-containing protein [Krasilnikoviella flava]